MANVVRTFSTDGWPTGLTLTYALTDTAGSAISASGAVVEIGGGNYYANITLADTVRGKIVWTSAGAPGQYAVESFEAAAQDALAAYDPPTSAEFEARTLAAANYATAAAVGALPTAATIATAVVEKDISSYNAPSHDGKFGGALNALKRWVATLRSPSK